MANSKKGLLFYNPKSGHSRAEHQCEVINEHFANHNIELVTILVPKPHDEIHKIISTAIDDGTNFYIAAGGDGTVSMVGTHLVGTEIPIGIIPLGTGNLLAKALNIPLKLESALDLITSDNHEIVNIDTFELNDRYFLLNVSIGVSPKIMESVDSDQKQRLGFFAYLINFIQQLLGLKLHRVAIEYDHKKTTYAASEILITNIGTAGVEPLTWSEDIIINDGTLDLLIFRAANLFDILGLVIAVFSNRGKLNPVIKFLKVREYCRLDSQSPLHSQADGDIVGETPFEIRVCPNSLRIIAGKDKKVGQKEGV